MYVITFLRSQFSLDFFVAKTMKKATQLMGRKWIIYWWSLENDPSKMNEMFAKFKRNFVVFFVTLSHNNWNESMYCENIMIYVL